MELKIKNTNAFIRKLKKLSESQQDRINQHVKKLTVSYQNGRTYFNNHIYQPYQFSLKNNLDSSLYVSRVSQDLRLILSIDEDPLFENIEVNLFDIANKIEEETIFRKVGESIYRAEYLIN